MIIPLYLGVIIVKNLRSRFERFCYQNRHKGIPNLMLYVTVISAIIYVLTLFNGNATIYTWLNFDKIKIMQGQIWRLFTFIFIYPPDIDPFLTLIGLYFFYHLGRHVELIMGTFRFNLYYFSGVLLMVIFAMVFCPTEPPIVSSYLCALVYSNMAWYMHLTLFLAFAAASPESQFYVFFFIPVKAWFLSIVYLVLIVINIHNLAPLFPHNLFPLAALANFLLFTGKDVLNLLPEAIRPAAKPKKVVHIHIRQDSPNKTQSYTHRCTICGRTDVSNPELEFRYCSRCNGYFCYCEDHINSHTHVE